VLVLTNPRGQPGEEAEDFGYNFAKARRRSNSSTHARSKDFKTKFEVVEREPVFEDMPYEEEEEHVHLEKQTTASSTSDSQSVEEDDHN
jgi:hypothetical protein